MNDYVFIDQNGQLLVNRDMEPHEAAEYAQALAREYLTTVTYAQVVAYGVKPDRCQNCGAILNLDSTCPDCGRNG